MTIAKDVASALKWSSAGKLGGQLISWAVTLLVIRILAPADYGLLAIATAFVSLIVMLGEAGVEQIVVRARALSEPFIRSLFGLVLLTHLVAALGIAALSVPVAHYYADSKIQPVMTAIGFGALLLAFTQIPSALLLREMNFRLQAMVALATSLLQSATTLVLAYSGAGVWSLVAGQLLAIASTALLLNWQRPCLPRPSFRFHLIKGELKFGLWISVQRITWWLLNSFDQLLLGKLLGPAQLGYYTIANQLAGLPKDKLSQIINQVTFSAAASVENPALLRSHLLRALGIMSAVIFPIFAVISAMAQDIVTVILSPKWQAAMLPLVLLPLAMPFRMIATPLASTVNALGQAALTAKMQLASLVLVIAGISFGANWGMVGVCSAWIVVANVNLAAFVFATRRISGIGYGDLLRVMHRPIACCGLMYAAVWAAQQVPRGTSVFLDQGLSRLLILLLLAAAVYIGSSLFLNRRGVRDVLELLTLAMSPSRAQ